MESGSSSVQSLIAKDKSVFIPTKPFKPVTAFIAEQKQVVAERVKLKILFDDASEPSTGFRKSVAPQVMYIAENSLLSLSSIRHSPPAAQYAAIVQMFHH